jgi:hypothetical protein
MDIERGTIVEIIVSVGAVGLFVAVLVGIGDAYNHGGLSADGGIALVGAIVAFVIGMSIVGIGLAYYLNQE